MNSPMKKLRLDKNNLLINACVQGRHRSVANKECHLNAISRMYKGHASHIEMIDLQEDSHWTHLCKSDCVPCNLKSKEFAESENKAYELLKHFVPVKKTRDTS